jgi:hypothetical protein
MIVDLLAFPAAVHCIIYADGQPANHDPEEKYEKNERTNERN